MRPSISTALAAVALFALPVGCAAKKDVAAPPAAPPAYAYAAPPTQMVQPDASIDTNGLHISDAIARACGLPRAESAPRFDYDSAAIGSEDRELLAALARCLSDGALRGKDLSLIGRADPRGENEYNMGLGESRADSVKRYLRDLGIKSDRVKATSRGEIDAMGTDETTWAHDRRVDIELASR